MIGIQLTDLEAAEAAELVARVTPPQPQEGSVEIMAAEAEAVAERLVLVSPMALQVLFA